MLDFFTYPLLGSLTGAVTATVLVVEFLKNLGPLKRLPTRWLALTVAEGIVMGTGIATGHFTFGGLPLFFLNGLLVAATAMGSWHVVYDNFLAGHPKNEGVFEEPKG